MLTKQIKVILILLIVLIVTLLPCKITYAHSVELDPESLISMPMMIISGSGTITINSSVTDYTLYFQTVKIDDSDYSEIEQIMTDGENELETLKESYTSLKTEVNNLKEIYNTAYNEYSEGLEDTTLSDEEKEALKEAYETAEANYENKVTEYNNAIDEYNNKVSEINSNVKELTPMYVESDWIEATDNKVTVDTTQFSGDQAYTIWAKLVTSNGTYYDESIYTITGTKTQEIDTTESEDDSSENESAVSNEEDYSTTTQKSLPYAGLSKIMLFTIFAIILIVIICYKKYYYYKDIK